MRLLLALSLLWAGTLWPTICLGQPAVERVRAVGTEFEVSLSDGRVLTSAGLVGATLSVRGLGDRLQVIRVDAVQPDPANNDIQLHSLSVRDPATGSWSNLCDPGPDGLAMAFPLSGSWAKDGAYIPGDDAFALICTGGAIGKCVRWGYKPWQAALNGRSLRDYLQACVRMVRADYGGDGVGYTRDDTPIDVFDTAGVVPPASNPGSLTFEAGWGIDGAVCVRKPRIPSIISLSELEQRYPRLSGRTGEACREDNVQPDVLILNRS
jgi:hypothetical protein